MEKQIKMKYLVFIEPSDNHNKFYRMVQVDNRKFIVEFGRVGAQAQKRAFLMSSWDKKYKEKLEEGYEDHTELHSPISLDKGTVNLCNIGNPLVAKLFDKLIDYTHIAIKNNYVIEPDHVTNKMLETAQKKLKELSSYSDIEVFNKELISLFSILPRKMSNVSEYLAHATSEYEEILQREQDLLDVMSGEVIENETISKTEKDQTDYLKAHGLEVEPCTELELSQIKKHLGSESAPLLKHAYRVKNIKTEKRFTDYCEKTKMSNNDIHFFYHGSRNQNMLSILNNGLLLNPDAVITAKMFGYGLYFAPRARKSLGYTSLKGYSTWTKQECPEGFLAVFKVAYKKQLDIHSYFPELSNFHYSDVKQRGCDALYAHKSPKRSLTRMLFNDEVIVYREEQSTIQYLLWMEN